MERDRDKPLALSVVFAHPDDEAFGVAATLARYAASGVHTALICATRGEAGMTSGLADSPAALAELRTAELNCAAKAMGLVHLALFDFADGAGATWDRAALAGQIGAELRQVKPAVVITFDPEGITRHPDHIAVQAATLQVVGEIGPALGIWRLYYQVVTCEEEASPEGPSLACVPLEAVDITVPVGEFEAIKRAALLCHRSQAADTADMLGRPAGALAGEHYQLAWSLDGWRPSPGESDLLAGLG